MVACDKERPNLRLNFAHFGGGDKLSSGDLGWMDAIIKMIGENHNIYTDI